MDDIYRVATKSGSSIMSQILFILGFIMLPAAPLFSHLYFYEKIQNSEKAKLIYYLSLIPSIILLCSAVYLSPSQTLIKSVECGVVKQYKTYKIRHRSTFERLAVVMDSSGYIRYFDFDETLPRLQSKQHVCFELYDRFKNKGLSESRIVKIISDK